MIRHTRHIPKLAIFQDSKGVVERANRRLQELSGFGFPLANKPGGNNDLWSEFDREILNRISSWGHDSIYWYHVYSHSKEGRIWGNDRADDIAKHHATRTTTTFPTYWGSWNAYTFRDLFWGDTPWVRGSWLDQKLRPQFCRKPTQPKPNKIKAFNDGIMDCVEILVNNCNLPWH